MVRVTDGNTSQIVVVLFTMSAIFGKYRSGEVLGFKLLNIGPSVSFAAGGSVDVGTRRYNIATPGRYRSADDVSRTVIGGANGTVVRMQDIAPSRFLLELDSKLYTELENGRPLAAGARKSLLADLYKKLERQIQVRAEVDKEST